MFNTLVTMEIQVKTTLRFYLTQANTDVIMNTRNNKHQYECVKGVVPTYWWWELEKK